MGDTVDWDKTGRGDRAMCKEKYSKWQRRHSTKGTKPITCV